MGGTIDDVKKNFDGSFGKGAWQEAEENCTKKTEEGSPDYFYFKHMDFK
jgi:hypothetical protein